MAFKILLALYLVVAMAMIFFILMQRGSGAQAGSGFGAGASGTVFGSSGAGNFLSISTKWLAVAFFGLSIGMGVYVSHSSLRGPATDLGVMAGEAAAADKPADPTEVPAATSPSNSEVPAATAPAENGEVPPAATAPSELPAPEQAQAAVKPASEMPAVEAPAELTELQKAEVEKTDKQ